MNVRAEIDREMDVLKRIVAMLYALGDLADRACGAPHAVRCLVLWLLRPAEAAARAYVLEPAEGYDDTHSMAIRYGNDPTDAVRLAASFRALALALETIFAQYLRFGCTHRDATGATDKAGRAEKAGCRIFAILRRSLAFDGFAVAPAQYPDTS